MEQLTRYQASRKGLKSHVTRIYNKIDSLIEQEADDYSIPLLTKAMEQLQNKADKLNKIDEQITSLINDPQELEDYIVESEELSDEISDKLTRVKTFIDLYNCSRGTVSSQIQPQVSDAAETVSTTESGTTTVLSNIEASLLPSTSVPQLDSVATLAAASHTLESSQTVLSSILTPSTPVQSTSVILPSVSTPKVFVTDNSVMPPPLIPVTSYSLVTSPASWQSSVMFSIPDARSLYTPSVSQPTHGVFPTSAVGYAGPQQFVTSRLPKLSLPTFSGDPLTWQTFWDSFYAAIDANPNLSGIQKFTYLKAQLQGDAAVMD